MKNYKNFFKGIAIGVATLVPGVSGGTMAVILGIYDDLIHAISSFFEDWKKHSILLLQLGLGALAALALFSKLLENAMVKFPFEMRFLFMGIIIGGLPVLYRKSRTFGKRDLKDFIFLIIGLITVLLMSSEPQATTTMATSKGLISVVFLFIAGIIIAVALILPGISGSFMLLALGLYEVTLTAIHTVNIPFLIPIGLGVVVGTLATTKIIENLLHKYPGKTYMLIIGFVIGSLLPVFPGVPANLQILTSLVAFIVGFLGILALGKANI